MELMTKGLEKCPTSPHSTHFILSNKNQNPNEELTRDKRHLCKARAERVQTTCGVCAISRAKCVRTACRLRAIRVQAACDSRAGRVHYACAAFLWNCSLERRRRLHFFGEFVLELSKVCILASMGNLNTLYLVNRWSELILERIFGSHFIRLTIREIISMSIRTYLTKWKKNIDN